MRALLLLALVLAACSREPSRYGCGIAAVAGQSLLLEEFARAGRTLGEAPDSLPETLPVRMALAEAYRGLVGRSDSARLVIGVEGTLPATPVPGYGVLVVGSDGAARGVLLYEGAVIQGAPELGLVDAGGRTLPLIGLRTDLAPFEDARCPIFPDSLRR